MLPVQGAGVPSLEEKIPHATWYRKKKKIHKRKQLNKLDFIKIKKFCRLPS